jgi:hypothetical protein
MPPFPFAVIDLNLLGATKVPGSLNVTESARIIDPNLVIPLAPKAIFCLSLKNI